MPPPRFATPRDHTRPTYGGRTAAIAAMLGTPLLPWQRYVADVAGEIGPDGYLVHSKVIVTVQRQAGKTTLDLAGAIQSSMMGPNRRAWYTAQSGQHASSKWREYVEALQKRPTRLRRLTRAYLGKGSERLIFPNGSEFAPHPPDPESLHGKQSDRNSVDEAWAFTQQQGAALLQAIVPTYGTRRLRAGQQPQLWLLSTEGTSESTFFNGELDAARADPDMPGVALFDFGVPADADATDLDTIAKYHPGYGWTFDRKSLQDIADNMTGEGEIARALGNRRTGAVERLIPAAEWSRAAWPDVIPDGPIAFAAAAGVDGVDAAIVVAVELPDGSTIVAVVDGMHRPGTHWAGAAAAELARQFGAPLVIDRRGPSATVYDDAVRAGADVQELTTSDALTAVGQLMSGIRVPTGATWRYKPHDAFEQAAELASKRWIGDGGFLLGRRASIGSIAALEAGALAAWLVTHRPAVRALQLA